MESAVLVFASLAATGYSDSQGDIANDRLDCDCGSGGNHRVYDPTCSTIGGFGANRERKSVAKMLVGEKNFRPKVRKNPANNGSSEKVCPKAKIIFRISFDIDR